MLAAIYSIAVIPFVGASGIYISYFPLVFLWQVDTVFKKLSYTLLLHVWGLY